MGKDLEVRFFQSQISQNAVWPFGVNDFPEIIPCRAVRKEFFRETDVRGNARFLEKEINNQQVKVKKTLLLGIENGEEFKKRAIESVKALEKLVNNKLIKRHLKKDT